MSHWLWKAFSLQRRLPTPRRLPRQTRYSRSIPGASGPTNRPGRSRRLIDKHRLQQWSDDSKCCFLREPCKDLRALLSKGVHHFFCGIFFFFFSIDLPVSEGFTELEARFPGKSFISERKHYHHVKPHQEVNMVIFLEEHDTSRLWSNSGRQVLTRSLGAGMEFDCLHAPLNFRRLSYVRPEMPGIFLWSWFFSWSKLAAPTKFFSCFFSCLVFFFFFK